MGILNRTGFLPVVISFFMISMLCFVSVFAPILWMTYRFDYRLLFSGAFGMSIIVTTGALISLRDVSPTRSMLIEKMSVQKLDNCYADNPKWQIFKAKIQAGDEVWKWMAWGTIWLWLGGHYGYVIMRNGQVTEDYIIDNF